MSELDDLITEAFLADLERVFGMVSLALVKPIKSWWEEGRLLPGISHDLCKPFEPEDESAWPDEDIPPAFYGSIKVSGDQRAEKATDVIRCICSECGKEFKLNAAYIEMLHIIHDPINYLEEVGPEWEEAIGTQKPSLRLVLNRDE